MIRKKLIFLISLSILILAIVSIIYLYFPFKYIPRGGGGGDAVHYVPESSFKIYNLAISLNSSLICKLINNRDCVHAPCPSNCITELAIKNKNQNLCLKIPKNLTWDIDNCLNIYALKMNDKTACQNKGMKNINIKEFCLEELTTKKAIKENNPNICFEETNRVGAISWCIQQTAKTSRDCEIYTKRLFNGQEWNIELGSSLDYTINRCLLALNSRIPFIEEANIDDWQSCDNYQFFVKYPKTFKVQAGSSCTYLESLKHENQGITFFIENNPKQIPFWEWAKKYYILREVSPSELKYKEEMISSTKWFIFETLPEPVSFHLLGEIHYGASIKDKIVLVSFNNQDYKEPVIKRILSTFKLKN